MIVARGGAWALEFLKSHPGSSNTWSRLRDTGPPSSSKATKGCSRPTSFLFLSLEVQFPEDIKSASYLKLNKAQSTTCTFMAIQLNNGVIQAPWWVYNVTIVYKETPQRWEGGGLTGRETLISDSLGSEGKCPASTEEMGEDEQRKQRGRLLSSAFDLATIIIHNAEKPHRPFTPFSPKVTSFVTAVHTTSLLFLTEGSKNKQIFLSLKYPIR